MIKAEAVHILYIEDDVGLARLLQKRLGRQGYLVDLAGDGETGIICYRSQLNAGNPYSLLIIDQNMPGMTGIEVIRYLTDLATLPPIIMVTGVGDESVAVEAMKLGAKDYLVKDVEGRYLTLMPSVVKQVLTQQQLEFERLHAVEALKKRTLDLMMLNQIGQELTAMLDGQQAIQRLLQVVVVNLNTESASVWLLTGTTPQHLTCYAVYQPIQHILMGWRLELGEGIAGWVVQTDKTAIVNDAQNDERFSRDVDLAAGHPTKSMIAVPLRVRGTVIGVLEVVNKLADEFTENDGRIVETLAASAAIAIDNARLIETLHQQNAMLAVRNEELDAFAGTVAHDLRSPLTPILGYANLLQTNYGETLGELGVNMVKAIISNTEKMADIIEALLLLSKLRHEQPDMTPLDMGMIVIEVLQRLQEMSQEYNAHITSPNDWLPVSGYRPWIEQVWINYISNAIKYGGNSPQIELKVTKLSDSMVRFDVQDDGPGISIENQADLFTPFTRLEAGEIEGHGLGLSIVKRIVEKSGGQVGVESMVGKGSTFWFTLPLTTELS